MTDILCYPKNLYNIDSEILIRNTGHFPNLKQYTESTESRYTPLATGKDDGFDFKERLEELNEELEVLNVEARELEARIAENVERLLEGE